jgi:cell division protein FtsQ
MTEPSDTNTGEHQAPPEEPALPPAAAPDYEGPRRRARREREERRAAQARATAIEHAEHSVSPPKRRRSLAAEQFGA